MTDRDADALRQIAIEEVDQAFVRFLARVG